MSNDLEIIKKEVLLLKCRKEACGHTWIPKSLDVRLCPKCHCRLQKPKPRERKPIRIKPLKIIKSEPINNRFSFE